MFIILFKTQYTTYIPDKLDTTNNFFYLINYILQICISNLERMQYNFN